MTQTVVERTRAGLTWLVVSAGVLVAALTAGFVFTTLARPLAHSRMLPWIAGSSLGLGAYAALTALVLLGTWFRHPWRTRWTAVSPEAALRAHAALGAAVLVLVAGHLSALALDRYAGVGWPGALVPGLAHYRTGPVALGVVAGYGLLAVAGTAGLAGRLTGARWLSVHRTALPLFALTWFHGVLAGSDTSPLRIAYVLSGLAVAVLATSRYVTADA